MLAPGLIGRLKDLVSASSPDIPRVADAFVAAMDQCQDEVEAELDAFLLDPGLGPMTYLTSDGRVILDMRGWDGEPMREASEDEAITALVVGAKKCAIGELLDLIPAPPHEGQPCPMCAATRWFVFGDVPIVCPLCRGRGWAMAERIARAEADGTWPLREAPEFVSTP